MQKFCLEGRKKARGTGVWQRYFFMAFLLFMLTFINTVNADSFRCGQKIVRTGDSPADLLRVCGEPRYKDKGYEKVRSKGNKKKVRVERWYYKKSSRRLEQIVLIHKGRIIAINTGKR